MTKYIITDGVNSVVQSEEFSFDVEPDSHCNKPTALFNSKAEASDVMLEDFPEYERLRVEPIECDEVS